MAKPNTRSIRAKQNSVLRYVVSTDTKKTAGDIGVSPATLQRFLRASPKTIQKHPENYGQLLRSNPTSVAKEKGVKLTPKLSGKKLQAAYNAEKPNVKAIRLARATREKRQIISDGKKKYVPISTQRQKPAREHILANAGGENMASILDQFHSGTFTYDEAEQKMIALFKRSGMSESYARDAFEKATS